MSEVRMFDDRATARIAGALFITATVTAIIGGSLLVVVDDASSLAELSDDRVRVVTGVLFELLLAVSVIGIASMLFPVLERADRGVAVAYVATRTVEAGLLAAATLVALVAGMIATDDGQAIGDGAVGDLVLTAREWTYLLGSTVMLGIGALMLYPLLRRAALAPRWLTAWGVIGGAAIVVLGVVEMYGSDPHAVVRLLLTAPIAVNEMVLAVWLIVHGFDPSDAATPALAGRAR